MNARRFLPKRVPTVLAVLFLAVQITIPTAAFFHERPARWSWQMFSGSKTKAEFVIVRDEGSRETVDPDNYLGEYRSEIDLKDALPAFICEHEPDVASITVENLVSDVTTEMPCER